MNHGFIPYGRQTVEDDDVAAVVAALRGELLTTGLKVEEYETALAKAVGATYAVACNSGTAALHLSMLAAELGPGDAAIVPSMTFLATANAVRMTGAEVIFADVDPATGLMTAETFAEARGSATRGWKIRTALPVHLNGQVCDVAEIAAVAHPAGIVLVEDACHAIGVAGIGSTPHSHMACFSTHAVKTITTAEGGMVTTADAKAAARMRCLRSHGMVREADAFANGYLAFDDGEVNPWYYEMPELGWNYRLPDLLCALGLSQLHKLDRFHRRRIEIAARYDRLLAPLSPVLRPVPHGNRAHGWHLYAVLIDFPTLGITRARFMKALRGAGIGTQVHYIPVHLQPYYRSRYPDVSLPGAETYYARCLSIPIYPAMTDADVDRVAAMLSRLVKGTDA